MLVGLLLSHVNMHVTNKLATSERGGKIDIPCQTEKE